MSRFPDWHEDAACNQADTRLFDIDARPADHGADRARDIHDYAINRYCNNCPVRQLCADAGTRGEEWGVWGGQVLAAGRPWQDGQPQPRGRINQCGTAAGYKAHVATHTAACLPCVRAFRLQNRDAARRRRAAARKENAA